MTTSDTINDSDIRQLRDEASQAGDVAQVAICNRALIGVEAAIGECVRVINEAEAMDDSADDQ